MAEKRPETWVSNWDPSAHCPGPHYPPTPIHTHMHTYHSYTSTSMHAHTCSYACRLPHMLTHTHQQTCTLGIVVLLAPPQLWRDAGEEASILTHRQPRGSPSPSEVGRCRALRQLCQACWSPMVPEWLDAQATGQGGTAAGDPICARTEGGHWGM